MFRAEARRITAWLAARICPFDIAEDAVQDALSEALRSWPERGVPDDPRAWLSTVARRRALDRLRDRQRLRAEDSDTEALPADADPDMNDLLDSELRDEQLRMIFMCCHPALRMDARLALTLRSVASLDTGRIAQAFLIPEATLAQRIVRAKRKIVDAGIPLRIPTDAELPARLAAVLRVVYLVFNEGYAPHDGEQAIRVDLCAEAIRLAELLVELMPDEPEARGLLALLLLTDARRPARLDADGLPVLLDDQDRSLWDRARIRRGQSELQRALAARRPGPYQIQAAIAALHDEASEPEATDWPQIVALYDELLRHDEGPVVKLNRAVALAMRDGPLAGLEAMRELEALESLRDSPWRLAARAELKRRAGDREGAIQDLRAAAEHAPTAADRRQLEKRLLELAE